MSDPPGRFSDNRAPGEEGKRYAVRWDLSAGHRLAGTIRGSVINVSSVGVLMRVPAPYEVGDIVEVEMSPATGVFIRMVVQIVRLDAARTGSYDYGAVILRHTDDARQSFNEALLGLRRQETASDFSRYPTSKGPPPKRK